VTTIAYKLTLTRSTASPANLPVNRWVPPGATMTWNPTSATANIASTAVVYAYCYLRFRRLRDRHIHGQPDGNRRRLHAHRRRDDQDQLVKAPDRRRSDRRNVRRGDFRKIRHSVLDSLDDRCDSAWRELVGRNKSPAVSSPSPPPHQLRRRAAGAVWLRAERVRPWMLHRGTVGWFAPSPARTGGSGSAATPAGCRRRLRHGVRRPDVRRP